MFCEMRVVPFNLFRDLGRIPRSSDGLTVASSTIEDDALVVFVSHRWLRPEDGDPDDEQNSKHAAICVAIKAITRPSSSAKKSGRPVYLWIDYASIEQDNWEEKAKGIAGLPIYVSLDGSMSNLPPHDLRACCCLSHTHLLTVNLKF